MLSSILAGEHRDYIPMQSTGLFDRNDKEIYEGDIIKRLFYGKDRTIVVERDEDYGGFNISYWLQEGIVNTDTRVVIGNIYENPELVNA
ncbi:MAG: YopX family protein [Candidatus Absconditicoccaceae bacterium]